MKILADICFHLRKIVELQDTKDQSRLVGWRIIHEWNKLYTDSGRPSGF